jgi:hypothetical protein
VVLTIVLAQLLAASAHGADAAAALPGRPGRPPRRQSARRTRLPQHGSLAGRRPRG